jgi:ribosomal protein L7/L12
VGALHVLLSQGEGHRQRWVEHACTLMTPSAEMRLDQVIEKKRALGLAVEVAQRFDVWVHQAPRMMDTIKALRSALKMEIGEAKTLLAELPARVAQRVEEDAAREACAALEAAGMTVERVVSA